MFFFSASHHHTISSYRPSIVWWVAFDSILHLFSRCTLQSTKATDKNEKSMQHTHIHKYWQNTEYYGDLCGNWLDASWYSCRFGACFFVFFVYRFSPVVFVQFVGFAGVEPNEQSIHLTFKCMKIWAQVGNDSFCCDFKHRKLFSNVLIRTHTHTHTNIL